MATIYTCDKCGKSADYSYNPGQPYLRVVPGSYNNWQGAPYYSSPGVTGSTLGIPIVYDLCKPCVDAHRELMINFFKKG